MKKCLIVSGGEYAFPENMKEYDLIIACDRGYENCIIADVRPDLVIGDFDSYEGRVPEDIEIKRLDPVKDDTDTISAVRCAFERGCGEIDICCALGGRFDHSMANVQTAAFIMNNSGVPAVYGKDTVIYGLKNGGISVPAKDNCYLSVFAVSDVCSGVTIKGTKYEIENAELTNTYPIGVSNEWRESEARVSVKEGMLVIIISGNVKVA